MLSLSSCEGIFSGIYDNAIQTDKEFGFVLHNEKSHRGRIYIDASDRTKWHYISFGSRQVEEVTMNVVMTDTLIDNTPSRDTTVVNPVPEEWDFAIHRYDVKTNQGAAKETDFTDLDKFEASFADSDQGYVEDIWTTDKISVDLSHMMDGIVVCAEDFFNPTLSRWMNTDTSSMPPTYTLSHRIYVLRMADGRRAALKLVNYLSESAQSGVLTIDYIYPFE